MHGFLGYIVIIIF